MLAVEEGRCRDKARANRSLHMVGRGEKERKSRNSEKRVKSPRIKEFARPRVKFRKTCKLRNISREACEHRVKFRNLSISVCRPT
jgi:hypothetical protein